MTDRLRRFTVVSFIGALALLVALIAFFRHLDETTIAHHHMQHNQVLTQIITNSLRHHGLEEVLGITEVLGTAELEAESHSHDHGMPKDHHHPQPAQSAHGQVMQEFDMRLSEHIENLSILKIKLFNRNGVVVYSSDSAEIGEYSESPGAIIQALQGETSSEFVYREEFKLGRHELKNVNIHESYVPIRIADGKPLGVLEIYTDITGNIEQRELMERRMIFGVLLLLGSSYTVLFLIFYGTDRALQREEAERNAYLVEIEQARNQLEARVLERTAEIESARYFLQSIINGIADPVMVIGMDLKVIEMNQAVHDLIPKGSEQGAYSYCYQISHRRTTPCNGGDHPCSFEEVIRTGKTCKLLHTHYDAKGNSMYVEVISSPLKDVKGELIGIIEVCHDVTDVVKARDEVQQSQQRISAVMDTVNSGILTLDGRGVVQDANSSAQRIFGEDRNSLIGAPVLKLFSETFGVNGNYHSEHVQQYLDPLLSQQSTETTIIRTDGSEIPAELWMGRIEVAGDTLYIAVFQDISERKYAEEELAQTRQQYFHQEKMAAIGQLAAGILHEVGNPIASISGSIQAIQSSHEDDLCHASSCQIKGDVLDHLNMIEEQINRLASITREIADFASPRLGNVELLDLNGLISSTINLMRYDKRLQKVDLKQDLDPTLPAINGVADQLTQVLMNLIINAVDACEGVEGEQPEITVRTRLDGSQINVQVIDNGMGMAPEIAERSLDAFFTTKPAGKGTGLGLSLCDTIMTKHGGKIRLESQPGSGTTVQLTLPATTI